MEVRAMAIALFYSVGTGFAILSPTLFGALIATKSRTNVDYGYLLGAALMIGAGLVAVFLAVNAERRSLEDIARPLTARQRPADRAAVPLARVCNDRSSGLRRRLERASRNQRGGSGPPQR